MCHKIAGKPLSTQPARSNEDWKPFLIHPFPTSYSPARTSFAVKNKSLETIAHQITECLRLRSIKTQYDSAQAVAKCETSTYMQFYIRLYQGRGKPDDVTENKRSDSEEEEGVLVEVQRKRGDCFDFRDEYIALRESILYNHLPVVLGDDKVKKDEEYDPEEHLRAILKEKYIPIPVNTIERDIRMVAKNITNPSSSLESIIFSLKELVAMTNVKSSSKSTSLKVSRMILMEYEFFHMRHKIMEIINSVSDGSEAMIMNIRIEDTQIQSLALTILVNALKALIRSDSLVSNMSFLFDEISDCVIPSLVEYLNLAEHDPYIASLAAKCISLFFSVYNSAETMAEKAEGRMENNAIRSALNHGKKIGVRSYYCLEKEATDALKEMTNSKHLMRVNSNAVECAI